MMKNKFLLLFMHMLFEARTTRVIVAAVLGVSAVVGCGWNFMSDDSVRFNTYRHGRGFYRLPPLPLTYDAPRDRELSATEKYQDGWNYEWEPAPEVAVPNESATAWTRAMNEIGNADLFAAKNSLERYLSLTAERSIDEDQNRQTRRNTAFDMIDAIGELTKGSNRDEVREYLDARTAFDQGKKIDELIAAPKRRTGLADNWEYLKGAAQYSNGSKEDALRIFSELVIRFPHGEKNQAARYMAGRILTELSYVYEHEGCGIEGKTIWGEPIDPADVEPREKCRDENWSRAMSTFQELLRDHPAGRFANDARGWIAYLHRRGGDRPAALAEYYRLLGNKSDRNARLEAKKSLQIIGHTYDDPTLDKTESLIADDSDAAMAYIYHRIYNHAYELTYQEISRWEMEDSDSRIRRQAEVAKSNREGRNELERTVRFAAAMMKRYPRSSVSSGFMLRLAEARLELQEWNAALATAKKALSMGLSGELRAQGIWVVGSAQHALGDLAAARRTFTNFVSEFPNSKLTSGARRLIAITAEDQGDLESALEQYILLDYREDTAYFLDVLMSTDRIAGFVASHPKLPGHDQRLYALGVRYMRERRWDEARTTLRKVRAEYVPSSEPWINGTEIQHSKEPMWGESAETINIVWVMQDLQTIDILEHLEKAVESAADGEAKAEAMYQLASFYYDADDLLLYNPSAWNGVRIFHLYDLEMGKNKRRPDESEIILDHSKQHETYARAIPIYQEIVERYPDTKAAEDAVFSMVVAHERLSNLNDYWREIYGRGLFAGMRQYDYADLARMYPKYRMPISRLGWEPSTRTVNGGPAWKPLPKPKAPLSLRQRAVRKAARWYEAYSPKPVAAAAVVWNGAQFYLKTYLSLWFAAFFGLLAWSNRSLIRNIPSSRTASLSARIAVTAYRAMARAIVNALPRLSLLYLIKWLLSYFRPGRRS